MLILPKGYQRSAYPHIRLNLLPGASALLAAVSCVFLFVAKPDRLFAQQADPTQTASNMLNVTRQWLDGKLSTPGVTAKLREKEPPTQDHGVKVSRYNMIIDGAPKDQTYDLISWPISSAKPVESLKGLSIGADGVVVCAGKRPDQCVGEKEDDPFNLVFPTLPGEVVRLALVSSDQKTKVFVATVPDPITAKSGPCSIEVIRLMPQFALAFIRAKGYAANEEIIFSTKSYGESHQQDVKSDSEGNAIWGILPAVKGKQSGKTNVSAKGGNCTASISFDWGQ
jgi:hypothetical protein